jgi:hypothetical protein
VSGSRSRTWFAAAVALAVIAAALIIWAVTKNNGSSSAPATGIPAVALSPQGLASASAKLGQPVYWAGPKPGYTYEYTQTADRKTYVRYLPPGVGVGDSRTNYLIITTYPFANAFPALEKVSNGQAIKVAGGGIAVVDQGYPKSVHLAFPGVDYQVEVFDPSAARSRAEAISGDIAPAK